MIKIQLIFVFLTSVFIKSNCQLLEYEELINKISKVELPLQICSYSKFLDGSNNQVKLYNTITQKGVGYFNHKGELRKATASYSEEVVIRTHEQKKNTEYSYYKVRDSTVVYFVGNIKLRPRFTCLIVKMQEVPDEYQKAYFYKLFSFNTEGKHLSTIKVFELIDDDIAFDWIEHKLRPNVTSTIKEDGSIEITWDEGYNEIYIQHVKLNSEGVFYVEKLEEKLVRD